MEAITKYQKQHIPAFPNKETDMTLRQLALRRRNAFFSSLLCILAIAVILFATGTNQPAAAQEPTDPVAGNGRIVFANSQDGHLEIYTMDPDGSDQRRLTNTSFSTQNADPKWSRDGTHIAFVRNVDSAGVYVMNEDGSDIRLVIAASNASRPSGPPTTRRSLTKLVRAGLCPCKSSLRTPTAVARPPN